MWNKNGEKIWRVCCLLSFHHKFLSCRSFTVISRRFISSTKWATSWKTRWLKVARQRRRLLAIRTFVLPKYDVVLAYHEFAANPTSALNKYRSCNACTVLVVRADMEVFIFQPLLLDTHSFSLSHCYFCRATIRSAHQLNLLVKIEKCNWINLSNSGSRYAKQIEWNVKPVHVGGGHRSSGGGPQDDVIARFRGGTFVTWKDVFVFGVLPYLLQWVSRAAAVGMFD